MGLEVTSLEQVETVESVIMRKRYIKVTDSYMRSCLRMRNSRLNMISKGSFRNN